MGWGNYRHQADVFHAYHVLKEGGLSPSRIIVMAYDDIASNPENPMPGKVFNRPDGPDVYAGVPIDYKGENVNAETFLAVLEGNAPAVTNKGTARVIKSGPADRVFVFYSDHGAAGVVGMPSGPFLYADQFMSTLEKKAKSNGFREMVLYIEACESGSMFEGLLDNDLDIYVTTAANAIESSWATYCPTFFFQGSSTSQRGTMHSGRALADSSSSGSGDEVLAHSKGLDDDSIVKAAQAVLGSVPATAAVTSPASASPASPRAGSPASAGPARRLLPTGPASDE